MKKNSTKKFFATLLSAAMILTSTGVSMIDGAKADAAGKAVLKQAKKTVSIRQGKKTTLKIKKKNIKKVRKIIWTSKNKKIATVSKKGVVKAVKAGKTTITAKVNYKAKGAKKFTNKKLKFTVKVTAKKAAATKEPAGVLLTAGSFVAAAFFAVTFTVNFNFLFVNFFAPFAL